MFEIVAEAPDESTARVLVTALRAHGFDAVRPGEGGLPGVRGLMLGRGIPIQVPEAQAGDARILAEDLLRDMLAR